jgi:hypothetical protein
MRFRDRPGFVPETVQGPLDFTWRGAREHIGPTETVTPLLDMLAGTTTCGQLAMCAGILLWGSWRFKGHTEVEHNFELAEAAFAWHFDHRFVNTNRGPTGAAPDQPPAISATMKLNGYMRQSMDPAQYWVKYFQPVRETFHASHIAAHVLPKKAKKDFEAWLKEVAKRVKRIASKPDEAFKKKSEFESVEAHQAFIARHRGAPIPPEILDPNVDVNDSNRDELNARFLAGLKASENRYLLRPEELPALGVEPIPYSA